MCPRVPSRVTLSVQSCDSKPQAHDLRACRKKCPGCPSPVQAVRFPKNWALQTANSWLLNFRYCCMSCGPRLCAPVPSVTHSRTSRRIWSTEVIGSHAAESLLSFEPWNPWPQIRDPVTLAERLRPSRGNSDTNRVVFLEREVEVVRAGRLLTLRIRCGRRSRTPKSNIRRCEGVDPANTSRFRRRVDIGVLCKRIDLKRRQQIQIDAPASETDGRPAPWLGALGMWSMASCRTNGTAIGRRTADSLCGATDESSG